jgi:hypothetical protein
MAGAVLMARLTYPTVLSQFRIVLSSWNFTGYITWKEVARKWVQANLEEFSPRAIGELMFNYFESGGEIDEVRETRPEWDALKYHYDFRIPINDQRIYIETILILDEPEEPIIQVVSIHYA